MPDEVREGFGVTPSESCSCVEDVDAKLDGQCVNASLFGVRRVAIDLIRTDKWVAENRRNKPRFVVATFCPFCGVRYPTDAPTPTKDSPHDH